MSCYKPLAAYRSLSRKNENGKSLIVFNPKEAGNVYENLELPCGQCIGCRIDRSRDWALRCVHEASLFENNCFVTLTFSDENLQDYGSLVKADFQNFMKRLRKHYSGIESVKDSNGRVSFPIRFFHCGEYGSQLERPHHHACLFNFDFDDKELWSCRDGVRLYRSENLERLWSKEIDPVNCRHYGLDNCFERNGRWYVKLGFCTIGDVTFESAAYVARYITKKMNGEKALEHYFVDVDEDSGECYFLQPEYITMSRRPGIGKRWFEKFKEDIFPKDFITHDGQKFRSPRYYDKIYDTFCPVDFKNIKRKRLTNGVKYADNNSSRRLRVREKVLDSRLGNLKRGFENGNSNV